MSVSLVFSQILNFFGQFVMLVGQLFIDDNGQLLNELSKHLVTLVGSQHDIQK